MGTKVNLSNDYMDHPSFSDPDKVREILKYNISSEDYRKVQPKGKSEEFTYYFKRYPVLKGEATIRLIIQYNLLKKLRREGIPTEKSPESVRSLIIHHNILIIFYALKKFHDIEHHIGQGCITLEKCVDRFDPSKGFAFMTYAVKSIYSNYLRDNKQDRLILFDNERLVDAKSQPDHNLEYKESISLLNSLLEILTDRERSIIDECYGLTSGSPKTLTEIGADLGISKERVRQIREVAFRKMRKNKKHLPDNFLTMGA